VPAQILKATQSELNGGKVGGMANAIAACKTEILGRSIFESKDNYVLDGHHRWAAGVGVEYANGVADNEIMMHVEQGVKLFALRMPCRKRH
jgi:hypothetical protein